MSCEIQPGRHNDQPTNQQGTKWTGKAYKWTPPKEAYFVAKMAVFGPNILIILGGSKSSGTRMPKIRLFAKDT